MPDEDSNALKQLEQDLQAAQERRKRAGNALRPRHRGGEWEEFRAADAAVLTLERALAAARGDEYAEPLDFPVQWNIGAPLPHVLTNDLRTFLIFLVNQPDSRWDGTYVSLKDPKQGSVERLAIVEFLHRAAVKLGDPNDEVFSGHPLYDKGLHPYTAQVVRNSRWIASLEKMNSVHPQYDPKQWRRLNHYVFWFKDNTFECAAEAFNLELFNDSFSSLLARVCARLNS